MAITYDWRVEQMEAYPEKDGHEDVVFTVHWRVNASEDNYNATTYGSIGVTLDASAPFTPYADLTKAQVIDWVQDAMGAEQVANIEANLTKQIADLKNPPVIRPALPWAAE